MLWSERTWAELPNDLAAAAQSAILPVGATEQHGPHMGCGMDFVLADRLCTAVAACTRVSALPTLPYGCSLGHSRRWPGTIAVKPGTLIADEMTSRRGVISGRIHLVTALIPQVHPFIDKPKLVCERVS